MLAKAHVEHTKRMIAISTIITIIFMVFASQLKLTMQWTNLLPSNDPQTIEYNRILKEFTSASSIVIVVQGDEQKIKEFGDYLAPRLLALKDTTKNIDLSIKIKKLTDQLNKKDMSEEKIRGIKDKIAELNANINFPFVKRVDYKINTDFLKHHSLMLTKEENLKNFFPVFTDPNLLPLIRHINDSMEKEYSGREESISTREKEDNAVHFIYGINDFLTALEIHTAGDYLSPGEIRAAADKLIIGDPYFLSYDRHALILNVIPNFSALEIDKVIAATDNIQSLVDSALKKFPGINAGLSGTIPLARDEMVYGEKSANYTTAIAGIAVLILLMISFKMWLAPIYAVVNLFIGILWAMGLTSILIGELNIMTQMMSVILVGLGIDFAIHIISGFTEWRRQGKSIKEAVEITFNKNGKGIITGGITTAFAFLTMMISSSNGMKEMGLVTGASLIAMLVETFLVLPIFLIVSERRKEKKGVVIQKQDITFRSIGYTSTFLSKKYIFTLFGAVVATILLLLSAKKITFDQNYLHMEPKGLTSIALMDTVIDKFDLTMDYALVLAESPEESEQLAKKYRGIPTAALVDDISQYLPSKEEQKKRVPLVKKVKQVISNSVVHSKITNAEIKSLDREIERLSWNIQELQDMAFIGGQDKVDNACRILVGSPDDSSSVNRIETFRKLIMQNPVKSAKNLTSFQQVFAPYFKKTVADLASDDEITIKTLPDQIIERYANKDTSLFLITIYPAANMWTDTVFLDNFVKDVQSICKRVTGMPPIFQTLMKVIGRDGRNALYLTIIVVFLLLLIDFGSARDALIAMLPLTAGIIWMVGLMHFVGMQFTVLNVMALPLIVGIGIDDGVHIIHRWRIEGKGSIHTVFASTGKAILLTTLTTMIAFGSLFFSIWRGFASLGSALFIGVGACFLTTVIILSGVIGLFDRNR